MKRYSDKILTIFDLSGTAVFALEGAMAGINANLDLFGVLVLSFITALAGGVIRDVLIGDTPPASLRDWRYPTTAFISGGVVFLFLPFIQRIPWHVVLVFDAAGLALFAIAGTEKALNFRMAPIIAIMMGVVTGVGGGTIRDVLLAQVPTVLRADIYATAALAGAACMVIARRFRLPDALSAVGGGVICFFLRMLSLWQHWNLPTAPGR